MNRRRVVCVGLVSGILAGALACIFGADFAEDNWWIVPVSTFFGAFVGSAVAGLKRPRKCRRSPNP